jgi:hypothetical protein
MPSRYTETFRTNFQTFDQLPDLNKAYPNSQMGGENGAKEASFSIIFQLQHIRAYVSAARSAC